MRRGGRVASGAVGCAPSVFKVERKAGREGAVPAYGPLKIKLNLSKGESDAALSSGSKRSVHLQQL